jgi:hypothetical protein
VFLSPVLSRLSLSREKKRIAIYGPLVMVIFLSACFVLRGYNISRADHGAAVTRLEEG